MALEGKSQEEIAALAELSDSVLSNPETAGVYQRLIKKANPGVSMPLVELEDKARAAFEARDREINDLKGKLSQTEAEKQASMLFENLRDDGIVRTKSDFSNLVKWASENHFITSEEGLRRAFQARQNEMEAAEPTPTAFGSVSLLPAKTDDFMKDPNGTARKVAAQVMDEIRTGKGKIVRH